MIATVSNKKNAVRVNRFIHVPPWVRMKTTTVPGGAMRPPSVARPSSAALDPWLCGPVLRRVGPYRGGASLPGRVGAGEGPSSGPARAGQLKIRKKWDFLGLGASLQAPGHDGWMLFSNAFGR